MNKKELIKTVAEKIDYSQKDVRAVLGGFQDVVKDTLSAGDEVSLIGFGTFSFVDRDARVARNPKTGESVDVPAKRLFKFKAGKQLKDSVR